MALYRIEVRASGGGEAGGCDRAALAALREAGLGGLESVVASRLFFLEGQLDSAAVRRVAETLLADPVTEAAEVLGEGDAVPNVAPGRVAVEVHPRPGVMDPVAESTLAELRAEGLAVDAVRTARRYVLAGLNQDAGIREAVGRVLANDCIEEVVVGSAGVRPSPKPPVFKFQLRHVRLSGLDDAALERLSREAHLFLSRHEMRAIQQYYAARGREPTDLELETLAQTWSEHCVHKTLRSAVVYRGAPLPAESDSSVDGKRPADEERRYDNLLKETVMRVTDELVAAGRGPECLSVFRDNAGVIAFDDRFGVAFKVETHNHPSAIEPYGGAATGVGGVIRDVVGCGLGARPIANTDVFCVAPGDWPASRLPKGVLHPDRVLRGVVRGVADYGNRMGIPTVNGAVVFDPRYLGNPLVYCGCLGLIPRDRIAKAARAGDAIVLVGGRTGRDGIHGATFSSAELTDTHADEFSHAVQIGNAITEKRVVDTLLQARDAPEGCLYSAITDCGAGGLSSAVGEMGAEVGAVVDLDRVPLKYAGLRYDEIWISEAQERMVVAVPPEHLPRFLQIVRAEDVEATVIGEFGCRGATGRPQVLLRFEGHTVGELDMEFLHHGVPTEERRAEWRPTEGVAQALREPPLKLAEALDRLSAELARPTVTSKAWIIRQYDHEVQGGSAVKPLLGPGRGPGDAAVLRPRLDSPRGVAVGCGLAPHLSDVDPYWMAAAAIDEAVRNVVSVGGDPTRTALLDNFCWGRTDDPRQLGGLVRACQACYDVARAYGMPFISGKDSLNNEFALDRADIGPLLATLAERAAGGDVEARRLRAILPTLQERVAASGRLAIPPTLLISALSLIDDVQRCVTSDLKRPGDQVLLVGGLPQIGFSPAVAATVHHAVAELIQQGRVAACHDVADGGWLVALAEMAIGGHCGVELTPGNLPATGPFEECCAGYVLATADAGRVTTVLRDRHVPCAVLGTVVADERLIGAGREVPLKTMQAAWAGVPE